MDRSTLAHWTAWGEKDFLSLLRDTRLMNGNLSSRIARQKAVGYVDTEENHRGKIPLTLRELTRAGQQAFDSYRRKLKDCLR